MRLPLLRLIRYCRAVGGPRWARIASTSNSGASGSISTSSRCEFAAPSVRRGESDDEPVADTVEGGGKDKVPDVEDASGQGGDGDDVDA